MDETVFYNKTKQAKEEITQFSLFDDDLNKNHKVLYNGTNLAILHPSDGLRFEIGGDSYSEGFSLVTPTLNGGCSNAFGESNYGWYGYTTEALFSLQGKYNKLVFDVGRETSQGKHADAKLQLYLDGELVDEKTLSSSDSIKSLSIDLKHAKDLRLVLLGDDVRYAFVNAFLYT